MKQKFLQSINETDILSSVPASAYFIETCSKAKNKDLGSWLAIVDQDSLSYVFELFKSNSNSKNPPEGMSLPVCDVVSLCLVIMEWESGEKFDSKDAWENSQPLIPRLRRAVLLESLSRKGLLKVIKTSIMSDKFLVELVDSKKIDSMLANCIGFSLVDDDDPLCDFETEKTYLDSENGSDQL